MTGAYFDTGVLAKLYCVESNSHQAVTLVGKHRPPLPFTHWQEIEIRTAMRLKLFRKEMTAAELKAGLRNLHSDLEEGFFQRAVYDPVEVFHRAEELSARHASAIGCRTLDIIHVAAAGAIGSREFVTLDVRQAELARKAGFKVSP